MIVTQTISGLESGHIVVGIDFKPTGGQLYVMEGPAAARDGNPGDSTAISDYYHLATINPASGAVTGLSENSPFIGTAGTIASGFAYNPSLQRFQYITRGSGGGINFTYQDGIGWRIEMPFGSLGPAIDPISGAAIGASGRYYFIGTNGNLSTSTGTPTVSVVGSMGIGNNLGSDMGFDVSLEGLGYASITNDGVTHLYSVNTATGSATDLGLIGDGTVAYGSLAVVPEPSNFVLLTGLILLGLRRRRL